MIIASMNPQKKPTTTSSQHNLQNPWNYKTEIRCVSAINSVFCLNIMDLILQKRFQTISVPKTNKKSPI